MPRNLNEIKGMDVMMIGLWRLELKIWIGKLGLGFRCGICIWLLELEIEDWHIGI